MRDNCNVQFDYDSFVHRYGFPSQQLALDVWKIVETTLERSSTTAEEQASLSTDSEPESVDEQEELEDEYQTPVIISDSDTD